MLSRVPTAPVIPKVYTHSLITAGLLRSAGFRPPLIRTMRRSAFQKGAATEKKKTQDSLGSLSWIIAVLDKKPKTVLGLFSWVFGGSFHWDLPAGPRRGASCHTRENSPARNFQDRNIQDCLGIFLSWDLPPTRLATTGHRRSFTLAPSTSPIHGKSVRLVPWRDRSTRDGI